MLSRTKARLKTPFHFPPLLEGHLFSSTSARNPGSVVRKTPGQEGEGDTHKDLKDSLNSSSLPGREVCLPEVADLFPWGRFSWADRI